MEIIVVEVKLLTSNMSNCWSTGSNWFSCGVVYFYKFILPLIHRFGRRSQKRLAYASLFLLLISLNTSKIDQPVDAACRLLDGENSIKYWSPLVQITRSVLCWSLFFVSFYIGFLMIDTLSRIRYMFNVSLIRNK